MIRHAFTIAWGLVALMLVLALVRLGLAGPGGTVETLALFGMPAMMAATMSLSQWSLRRTPPATAESWRRWHGTYYVVFVGVCTAAQAAMVCKALGLPLPVSPQFMFRGFLILFGLMLVVQFNRFPKLPPPSAASPPDLVRWGRMARLNSWVVVGVGLLLLLFGLAGWSPQTAPFLSVVANGFFVLALLAYAWHLWRSWQGAHP